MELESAREVKRAILNFTDGLRLGQVTFSRGRRTKSNSSPILGIGIKKGSTPNDYKLVLLARMSTPLEILNQIKDIAKGEIHEQDVTLIRPLSSRRQKGVVRPLEIGVSVGHYKRFAGTLGCFVRRKGESETLILSNNHVLANQNDANIHDVIIQPSRTDGGTTRENSVARLQDFVRLDPRGNNFVDAAIAAVEPSVDFGTDLTTLDGIGNLTGVYTGEVSTDLRVAKVGRTTGTTWGYISSIELDIRSNYHGNVDYRFSGVLQIEGENGKSFSDKGDSGALVVTEDGKAIGLIFSGSQPDNTVYACSINMVMDQLNIELAL